MVRRYRKRNHEAGRVSEAHETFETRAKTPQGFLALFYANNPNAPRGDFACLGPDADGTFTVYTKAGSEPVESYRLAR